MKSALSIFAALLISSFGFGQVSDSITYEEFQEKMNVFKTLVETNSDLILKTSDKEKANALADEIRQMSKELSGDVSELFECTNPNLGQKLTMSYALADVSPVLSQLYFYRTFVNDVCPEEKSKYIVKLDRIRHLAWRMKLTTEVDKKTQFSEEMRETLAVI
jgi:gas vesicle protein